MQVEIRVYSISAGKLGRKPSCISGWLLSCSASKNQVWPMSIPWHGCESSSRVILLLTQNRHGLIDSVSIWDQTSHTSPRLRVIKVKVTILLIRLRNAPFAESHLAKRQMVFYKVINALADGVQSFVPYFRHLQIAMVSHLRGKTSHRSNANPEKKHKTSACSCAVLRQGNSLLQLQISC